jgi:hypothetical protein
LEGNSGSTFIVVVQTSLAEHLFHHSNHQPKHSHSESNTTCPRNMKDS